MRSILTAAAVAAVLAVPAATHAAALPTVDVYHGADHAKVSAGYKAHPGHVQSWRVIDVWDHECDGHKVQAEYLLKGYTKHYHVYDPNGCAAPGARKDWTKQAVHIQWVRICELEDNHHWSCSGWRQIGQTVPAGTAS